MSRRIKGDFTDPSGDNIEGIIEVVCQESYSSVLKGSKDTFMISDGAYDFILPDGKYAFYISYNISVTSIPVYKRMRAAVGTITTNSTEVDLNTLLSADIQPDNPNTDPTPDIVTGFDFSINNAITTTDPAVTPALLSVNYGGTWELLGSQSIGAKSVFYFECISDTTQYTMTINNVGVI